MTLNINDHIECNKKSMAAIRNMRGSLSSNMSYKDMIEEALSEKYICNEFDLAEVSDAELQKRRIPVYSYLL